MAFRAVQAAVSAGEREKGMLDVGTRPPYRIMALLAVGNPSIGHVIRIRRRRRIGSVTDFALERGTHKIAGCSARMTALARGDGVYTDQRETGSGMLADQPARPPVLLPVTANALHAQTAAMRIDMAAGAPAYHIDLNRSAIVVTPQAGG